MEELINLVFADDIEGVRRLLIEREDIDVNDLEYYGHTVLHIAAYNSRLKMIELLLMHGADPHVEDYDQCTPLSEAISRNDTNVVELLRSFLLDIKEPDCV